MICDLQLTKEEEERLDREYRERAKKHPITTEMLDAMWPKKPAKPESSKSSTPTK